MEGKGAGGWWAARHLIILYFRPIQDDGETGDTHMCPPHTCTHAHPRVIVFCGVPWPPYPDPKQRLDRQDPRSGTSEEHKPRTQAGEQRTQLGRASQQATQRQCKQSPSITPLQPASAGAAAAATVATAAAAASKQAKQQLDPLLPGHAGAPGQEAPRGKQDRQDTGRMGVGVMQFAEPEAKTSDQWPTAAVRALASATPGAVPRANQRP